MGLKGNEDYVASKVTQTQGQTSAHLQVKHQFGRNEEQARQGLGGGRGGGARGQSEAYRLYLDSGEGDIRMQAQHNDTCCL